MGSPVGYEFDLSGVVGEAVTEAQLAEMQAAEVDEWGGGAEGGN